MYIKRRIEYGDTVGIPKEWHIKSLAVCDFPRCIQYKDDHNELNQSWDYIDVPINASELTHEWFIVSSSMDRIHGIFRHPYTSDIQLQNNYRYLKIVIEGTSSTGKYFEAEAVLRQPYTNRKSPLNYYGCTFTCDTTVSSSSHSFKIASKYDPALYEQLHGHSNQHSDWAQNPEDKKIEEIDIMTSETPANWQQWYMVENFTHDIYASNPQPSVTFYDLGWAKTEIIPSVGDISMKVTLQPNTSPNPRAIRVIATGHKTMVPFSYLPDGETEWQPSPSYDKGSFLIFQEGHKRP